MNNLAKEIDFCREKVMFLVTASQYLLSLSKATGERVIKVR